MMFSEEQIFRRLSVTIIFILNLFELNRGFVLECKPLPSETLSGFHQFVSESSGYADVCPFTISGEACQINNQAISEGYIVSKQENLYLSCDPYRRKSKCVINCPVEHHFTVASGSSLTLESMVLAGATDSAIVVETQGRLSVFDSIFENNTASKSGYGGAIYASSEVGLEIRVSEFENNQAEIGGAIYSMSSSTITDSNFRENFAAAAVRTKR
jgi:predicted outer membrane repeat protein